METGDFQGLIETFSFDEFGNVKRPFYISSIQDGKFVVLEEITLTKTGEE
ncbi:MAG: hypothetical protein AB1420_14940 [Bacillota bacterium]